MAATPQTQAIAIANTIIGLAQQLKTLSDQIAAVNLQWQDDGTANTLNALATTTVNVDGTAGTVDGTPNVAHPINVAVYTALNRAISANDLASLLTVLNSVPNYVAGGAISATPGVRGILNKVIGG